MNRQLRKLVSFTAAAAVMANTMILGTNAAYVGERLTENDFDSMVSMYDKDILIENGTAESFASTDQLVVIDKDGSKKLISLEEGITGVYTYSSTTLGQYNYLSPTPSGFSFDYFDPNYQLSTEDSVFIAGIGDKFALMDNDGKVVSEKYDSIVWMSEGFYAVFTGTGDSQIMGVIDKTGKVILAPDAEYEHIFTSSDGKYLMVHTAEGDYLTDADGKKVSDTYSQICGMVYYEPINEFYWTNSMDNDYYPEDGLEWAKKYYHFKGGYFRVQADDGTYSLLDASLKPVAEGCSSISISSNDKFSINRKVDEKTKYTLIGGDGKVYYQDADRVRSFQFRDPEEGWLYKYIVTYGDTNIVVDDQYNELKTFGPIETFSIDSNDYLISGTDLYNGKLELIAQDFDYEFLSSGRYNSIWQKDETYYSISTDFQTITPIDIPQQIEGSTVIVNYFSCESWYNSVTLSTFEDYYNEEIEADDQISVSWKYTVNPSGKMLNVTDLYSYTESADPDIAIVRFEEDGPFAAVDYSGNKTADIPEDLTSYTLDIVGGYVPLENGDFEYTESGRYNIFADAEHTKFSVYDAQMNLLEADVPGRYEGNWSYYSAEADENGSRKMGLYKPGTGVVFQPEYDNVSFARDVVILVKDGRTQIADYYGNILQDWEGDYQYNGGTGSAYLTRLTLNWHRDSDTKTIVYNSETDSIEFTQEGLYDNVDTFLSDYSVVTVYDKSDQEDDGDLWSSGEAYYGIIKIDGTEMIRPRSAQYVSIMLNGYSERDNDTGEWEHVDGTYFRLNDDILPISSFRPELNEQLDVDAALTITDTRIQVFKEGKWQLCDNEGNLIYEYALDAFKFIDGISTVRVRRQVEVTEKQYDWDTEQYVDVTRTYERNSYGIIDINGIVIADPMFSGDENYKEMGCAMNKNGYVFISYSFADMSKRIKAFDFTGKDRFNEMTEKYGYDFAFAAGDLYIVQKDGLQGVADANNNIIVPIEYTDILSFNANAVVGTKKDLKTILAQEYTDKLRELPDGSLLLYARTQDNKIRPFIIKETDDPVETTTTTTVTTTAAPATTTTAAQTTAASDVTTAAPATTEPAVTTAYDYDVPKYDRTNAERGDYNGDGKVDATDASDILVAYAIIQTGGGEALTDEDRSFGDLDGDGQLNAADASLALRYYSFVQTGGKKTFAQYMDEGLDEQ